MPIPLRCEHCHTKLMVGSKRAGQQVSCPKCGSRLQVPAGERKQADPIEVAVGLDLGAMAGSAVGRMKFRSSSNAIESAMTSPTPFASQPSAESAETVATPIVSESGAMNLNGNLPAAPFQEFAVYDEPEVVIADESGAYRRAERQPIDYDRLAISRSIVYLQGALLGLVAISFFSLGWWFGSNSSHPQSMLAQTECMIQGSVVADVNGRSRSDSGSVVMFLPVDRRPQQVPDPELLQPGNRLTFDNESVRVLREMGGAVVSVAEDGTFEAKLNAGQEYYVFVLSKNAVRKSELKLSKQQRAEIGTYFRRAEDIMRNRSFSWERILATGKQQKLREIKIVSDPI
jgi:hypothetical protein